MQIALEAKGAIIDHMRNKFDASSAMFQHIKGKSILARAISASLYAQEFPFSFANSDTYTGIVILKRPTIVYRQDPEDNDFIYEVCCSIVWFFNPGLKRDWRGFITEDNLISPTSEIPGFRQVGKEKGWTVWARKDISSQFGDNNG